MKVLKQAIDDNDCLLAGLALAKIIQEHDLELSAYISTMDSWAQDLTQVTNQRTDFLAFKRFIRYFYFELAFSGDEQHYFTSQCNLINQVMDFRTGTPVSLSIVFQALATRVGFNVAGVNFPGHFLIKCKIDKKHTIYLDPLNGQLLSKADLSRLYFSILTEIENETMPEEALFEASSSETIVHLLHNLKSSYINHKSYSHALDAVQLLVELCPNDPYERRDRGYLLHQLDCTEVAIADYRYFIRQCPDDPSSQLLQAQLLQLSTRVPQVFH